MRAFHVLEVIVPTADRHVGPALQEKLEAAVKAALALADWPVPVDLAKVEVGYDNVDFQK